jgi:hypothetical protein
MCPALAAASGLDLSAAEVQAGLGNLLGCKWKGMETNPYCDGNDTESTVEFYRDQTGKGVETVEINIDLVDSSVTPPRDIMTSRDTVLKVAAYLLPQWKNRTAWLRRALNDAARIKGLSGARKVIKLGNISVLVEGFQPVDAPVIGAMIVITKKASLDEWR